MIQKGNFTIRQPVFSLTELVTLWLISHVFFFKLWSSISLKVTKGHIILFFLISKSFNCHQNWCYWKLIKFYNFVLKLLWSLFKLCINFTNIDSDFNKSFDNQLLYFCLCQKVVDLGERIWTKIKKFSSSSNWNEQLTYKI